MLTPLPRPESLGRLLQHRDFRSDLEPVLGPDPRKLLWTSGKPELLGFEPVLPAHPARCDYRPDLAAHLGSVQLQQVQALRHRYADRLSSWASISWGCRQAAGALKIGSIISYLRKYVVTPSDGTAPTNYAGAISDTFVTSDGENLYSHPRWKANSYLSYLNGPFIGTLRWRYIGQMNNLEMRPNEVPAVSYFDVDAHYTIDHRFTISAGITNITDKKPPFIGTLELRTDAATYDVVGRTWFVGAKVRFARSAPPPPPPSCCRLRLLRRRRPARTDRWSR